MYDLEARVALLTGASRGIGAATARALAAQRVHLSLIARSGEELSRVANECREYRVGVMATVCDVREPAQVEWAVKNTVKEYGHIDLLINNARDEEKLAEELMVPQSNREFARRFAATPLLRAGRRRIQGLMRRLLGE